MYERREVIGDGRFAGEVLVMRYPERGTTARGLEWVIPGRGLPGRVNLVPEIADRFTRSLRHAWDLAAGSAQPPPGTSRTIGEVFIGRFAFDIRTGMSPCVTPLSAERLRVSSTTEVAEFCALVEAAVAAADRIEAAPDFQLESLPYLPRPDVSSWIDWPLLATFYERVETPFALSDGRHRHTSGTHGRATYPDPAGCDTCYSEADALIEYHHLLRKVVAGKHLKDLPVSTPAVYLDPPGGSQDGLAPELQSITQTEDCAAASKGYEIEPKLEAKPLDRTRTEEPSLSKTQLEQMFAGDLFPELQRRTNIVSAPSRPAAQVAPNTVSSSEPDGVRGRGSPMRPIVWLLVAIACVALIGYIAAG